MPRDGLGLARVTGTLAPVTGGEGDDERLSQLRSEAWERSVHARTAHQRSPARNGPEVTRAASTASR